MQLDIRLPIGLMFALLGALLSGYGLIADQSVLKNSLGLNVNLWWGLVMLGFGIVMSLLGRRGTAAARAAGQPEGKRTAEVEDRREVLK